MSPSEFRPAWWIPGRHAQTLWGRFFRKRPDPPRKIEIWKTPDGDSLEIHRVFSRANAPQVLVLHGLEGTERSHYARGLLAGAYHRGWNADLMIFRSCGAAPSTAPRLYHSGETSDLAFVIDRLRSESPAGIGIVGVSLGGNVTLKYLGERGTAVNSSIVAAAAISVPFDLSRSASHINHGFARVYQAHFLRSLRRKAVHKLLEYPSLADATRVAHARTMVEYDNAMTSVVHGFADANEYYTKSSSLNFLEFITVPTLLLSAVDDPFLPAEVLDDVQRKAKMNPRIRLHLTAKGGHVGFIGGRNPFRPVYFAEQQALDFMAEHFSSMENSSE